MQIDFLLQIGYQSFKGVHKIQIVSKTCHPCQQRVVI